MCCYARFFRRLLQRDRQRKPQQHDLDARNQLSIAVYLNIIKSEESFSRFDVSLVIFSLKF